MIHINLWKWFRACEPHQSNSIKQHQPATAQPQGLKLLQHPLDVGPEVTLHVVQLRLHASALRPNVTAGRRSNQRHLLLQDVLMGTWLVLWGKDGGM